MYYCDFCRKRGQRSDVIRKHESRCTGNPDRYCGFCGREGDTDEIKEVAMLGLDMLREFVFNCPACMLVGVRHLKGLYLEPDSPHGPLVGEACDFDYREQVRAFEYDEAFSRLQDKIHTRKAYYWGEKDTHALIRRYRRFVGYVRRTQRKREIGKHA